MQNILESPNPIIRAMIANNTPMFLSFYIVEGIACRDTLYQWIDEGLPRVYIAGRPGIRPRDFVEFISSRCSR